MRQLKHAASLSAIVLGLLLAGCGDGQQSDWTLKLKALLGGQSASPTAASEADPQQARQNRLNELLKKAEAGDVSAMVDLGRAYADVDINGDSVARGQEFDPSTATLVDDVEINRDAVARGQQVPLIDLGKAATWFEKAATKGNADAQFHLGRLLQPSGYGENDVLVEHGAQSGPKQNWPKAIEWLNKAAMQNHPGAVIRLAEIYAEGYGVKEDKWLSFQSYLRAAELGNAYAQQVVGDFYLRGAPQDPKGKCTHEYLSDNPNYGKGNIFDQFDAPFCLADKDVGAAVGWYEKSAAQGFLPAQSALAWKYRSGEGVPKDAVRAFSLFKAVADKADEKDRVGYGPMVHDAQAILGVMYRLGEGVSKDDAKAVEWYQRAASSGQASAQQNLGVAYLRGEGIATDNVLAYAWSNLAGGLGLEGAGKNREIAASLMTQAEIAEAQRLSSGWKVGMLLARESGSAGVGKQPASPGSLVKINTGTAFIVNASGHAITNHHVVEGCTEVRAEGRNGVVRVVTSDLVNDLAQLQIPGPITAQAPIASNPAKLRQGEDIVVFGFPLNAVLSSGGNLTPGVVSALTGLGNNTNQIQITAPIQPGSSGSPVINKKGEVVGVVAMKLSDSKMARATGQVGQNVNFAVSGQTLKTFLDTHKVDYGDSGMFSFGSKSTADLADEARKWTLVVECWK